MIDFKKQLVIKFIIILTIIIMGCFGGMVVLSGRDSNALVRRSYEAERF